MVAETEDDYFWAVTQQSDLIQTNCRSNAMAFVTDREIAHMNEIKRGIPPPTTFSAYEILFKNVLANLKMKFAAS